MRSVGAGANDLLLPNVVRPVLPTAEPSVQFDDPRLLLHRMKGGLMMVMSESARVALGKVRADIACSVLVREIERAVDLLRTTKIQKLEIQHHEGLPRVVMYRIGNAQIRIDLFYIDVEAAQ